MNYDEKISIGFKGNSQNDRVTINTIIFRSLLPKNCKISKVIDLGCGNGHFTSQLAEEYKDAHITGVDISPEMIKLAEKRPNINYIVENIINLQKSDYDIVTSFCMLCHAKTIDELRLMVSICYNQLKNGGYFIGTSANTCETVEQNEKNKNFGVYYPELTSDDIIKKARIDGSPIKLNVYSGKNWIEIIDTYWDMETYKKIFIETGFKDVEVRYIKTVETDPKFLDKMKDYLESPTIFFITARK